VNSSVNAHINTVKEIHGKPVHARPRLDHISLHSCLFLVISTSLSAKPHAVTYRKTASLSHNVTQKSSPQKQMPYQLCHARECNTAVTLCTCL